MSNELQTTGGNEPVSGKSRKVTAFSSGANQRQVSIMTEASTWGELMRDFDAAGVNYAGMTVIERKSRVSFDLPEASLPKDDFVLYLVPKKTESGGKEPGLDGKQLRADVQAIIARDPSAKAFFTVEGKNYTLLKKEVLHELIQTWKKRGEISPKAGTVAPPATTPAPAQDPREKAVQQAKQTLSEEDKLVEAICLAKSVKLPAGSPYLKSLDLAVAHLESVREGFGLEQHNKQEEKECLDELQDITSRLRRR